VVPAVYHPPIIHRDRRHIHPMVTRGPRLSPPPRASHGSLRYPLLSVRRSPIRTGAARWKRSTQLFSPTRCGTSCRVRQVAMW
jgi:hypothetical protein